MLNQTFPQKDGISNYLLKQLERHSYRDCLIQNSNKDVSFYHLNLFLTEYTPGELFI